MSARHLCHEQMKQRMKQSTQVVLVLDQRGSRRSLLTLLLLHPVCVALWTDPNGNGTRRSLASLRRSWQFSLIPRGIAASPAASARFSRSRGAAGTDGVICLQTHDQDSLGLLPPVLQEAEAMLQVRNLSSQSLTLLLASTTPLHPVPSSPDRRSGRSGLAYPERNRRQRPMRNETRPPCRYPTCSFVSGTIGC